MSIKNFFFLLTFPKFANKIISIFIGEVVKGAILVKKYYLKRHSSNNLLLVINKRDIGILSPKYLFYFCIIMGVKNGC